MAEITTWTAHRCRMKHQPCWQQVGHLCLVLRRCIACTGYSVMPLSIEQSLDWHSLHVNGLHSWSPSGSLFAMISAWTRHPKSYLAIIRALLPVDNRLGCYRTRAVSLFIYMLIRSITCLPDTFLPAGYVVGVFNQL
jgi:hypothetical protein